MTKRTAITIAVATATILLTTAAYSIADLNRRPDRGVAGALARADRSYARGDLGEALQWLDRARHLVAEELAGGPRPGGLERSNASDLLRYLDYYRAVAAGRDPELDGAYRFLTEQLTLIRLLECGPDRPTRIGDLAVSTWGGGRVFRIGDVDISHWGDGRIHRIGSYDIGYWGDGRPYRIGGIDYSYRAGAFEPWRVAGVEMR